MRAMSVPRSAALVLAGLAAGVAVRVLFPLPEKAEGRAGRRFQTAGNVEVSGARPVPAASARPLAADILAAQGGSRYRRLMAWLPGATEEELARLATDLARENTENLSIRLLMVRWAEVNPAALLAWADASGGFYQSNAIQAWARVDFSAAWAAACTTHREWRTAALLGLTAVDPAQCLRRLRDEPALLRLDADFADMNKVLTRIAQHDPAGAAALAVTAPERARRPALRNIAREWMKVDPVAAIAWLRTLDPAMRRDGAESAGDWLGEQAPEHLPALLDALPAGPARSSVAAAAFASLARRDPAAARAQLDAMPDGPARQHHRALFMRELFRGGDEAGALALAEKLGWHIQGEWLPGYSETKTGSSSSVSYGDVGELKETFGDLLTSITARDPGRAAEIIAAHPELLSLDSDAFETGPADQVASEYPEMLAAAFLARRVDPRARKMAGQVIGWWSKTDPAAAIAWVDAHVIVSTDHSLLMSAVLPHWAEQDPAALATWATGRVAPLHYEAWHQLAGSAPGWVAAHPNEFFAANVQSALPTLLEHLAQNPEQERAILQHMPDTMDADISPAVARWLQVDAEEASQWVRDLPPGARRTNATGAMVGWLNEAGDRDAAFRWAATMPEEERAPLIKDTIAAWAQEDPQAAATAITGSGLPAAEVQQWTNLLREQLQPTPPAP